MKCVPPNAHFLILVSVGLATTGVVAWLWGSLPERDASFVQPSAIGVSSLPLPSEAAATPETSILASPTAAASPAIAADKQSSAPTASAAEIAQRQAALRESINAAAGIANVQKRNETLARLCYQWAELDPRGAVALADGFHLDEAGVLENLTLQWALVDLPAARTWIDARPANDSKSRLVARIGFLWAQTDPRAAANYILDQTRPGEIQAEAAISVLHQWAQQDCKAALTWAQSFPTGDLRDRALRETLFATTGGKAN